MPGNVQAGDQILRKHTAVCVKSRHGLAAGQGDSLLKQFGQGFVQRTQWRSGRWSRQGGISHNA